MDNRERNAGCKEVTLLMASDVCRLFGRIATTGVKHQCQKNRQMCDMQRFDAEISREVPVAAAVDNVHRTLAGNETLGR